MAPTDIGADRLAHMQEQHDPRITIAVGDVAGSAVPASASTSDTANDLRYQNGYAEGLRRGKKEGVKAAEADAAIAFQRLTASQNDDPIAVGAGTPMTAAYAIGLKRGYDKGRNDQLKIDERALTVAGAKVDGLGFALVERNKTVQRMNVRLQHTREGKIQDLVRSIFGDWDSWDTLRATLQASRRALLQKATDDLKAPQPEAPAQDAQRLVDRAKAFFVPLALADFLVTNGWSRDADDPTVWRSAASPDELKWWDAVALVVRTVQADVQHLHASIDQLKAVEKIDRVASAHTRYFDPARPVAGAAGRAPVQAGSEPAPEKK